MQLILSYLLPTPRLLYDGFEDEWVGQPWPLPQADGTTFLARLSHDVQPLENVASWVGNEGMQQLLGEVRAKVRDWSGHGDFVYKGYDGLPLYYVRHGQQLWVLAAGESQPARYKTYLCGCWTIS